MNEQPTISLVMPAYNAEKWLGHAVLSIIDQTEKDFELLILDDGSTDGTASLMRSFTDKRIRLFFSHVNEGYLRSCNRLFGECKGRFITFLDADDTCPPTRLATCIEAMENDTEAVAVITGHRRIWKNGQVETRTEAIDTARMATDPDYAPTLCGATLFVRARALKHLGGYHSIFARTGAEDQHLIWRLAQKGRVLHIATPLYDYRMHASAIKTTLLQPERHIGHSLDLAIRREFITKGIDLLADENRAALETSYARLLHPFDKDPALILRRASVSMLNMARWGKALRLATKAILTRPLDLSNHMHFTWLAYIMLRRRLQGQN